VNNVELEQFVATQKIGADVLLNLIRSACNGLERLTALNMSAAREFLNSSVTNAELVLAQKDMAGLSRLNLAQPSLQKWLDYSREVYDLVGTLQKEATAIAQGQYEQINKTANDKLAASQALPGGDVLTAAVKSFMQGYGRAFDQWNNLSRQTVELADANFQAVSKAVKAAPARPR
jgi:phasin family protein